MGISKIHNASEATAYAKEACARRKFPLASKLALIAIRLEPENPYVLTSAGAVLRPSHHLADARSTLEYALKLGASAPTMVSLAALERESGDPKKAVTLCRQILELHPDNGHALSGLGGAYHDLHNYQLAKECFAQALRILGPSNGGVSAGLRKLVTSYKKQNNAQGVARVQQWLNALDGPTKVTVVSPTVDGEDDIPFWVAILASPFDGWSSGSCRH